MRVGISCYDTSATELIALAVAAEGAGFSGIWLGEHVVAPAVYSSEHPPQPGEPAGAQHSQHGGKPTVDPTVELTDPLVALAAVAAHTRELRLTTGVFVLPLRHPLVVARAVATLADISGGRFALGVGSGWLREEFEALGAPFRGRARRLEEQIAIVRRGLASGAFSFRGEFYEIDDVQVCQRPIKLPIVMGGNTEPALRRAVGIGDAWFSSGVPTLEQALRLRDRVAELCAEIGKPLLAMTFRVADPDAATLERYAAEGIDDVVVMSYDVWRGVDVDVKREHLADAAERLGLSPSVSVLPRGRILTKLFNVDNTEIV